MRTALRWDRFRVLAALLPLALIVATAGNLPAREICVGGDGLEVRVVASDESATVLEITLGRFDARSVAVGGEIHYDVSLEGEGTMREKGAPALPFVARSIAIPGDARMELEILETSHVDLEMRVAPSAGPVLYGAGPPSAARSFSDVYSRNAFWPDDTATLGSPYILRDVRGITVRFFPFSYNPASEVLRVRTRVVVRVANVGRDVRNVKAPGDERQNESFRRLYESRFLNYGSARYNTIQERGRMIVIAHSDFMDAIQPYVAWKRQKGIETDLYDVAAIGSTPDDLWDFIAAEYGLGDGLTFVQLVGDAVHVPTYLTDVVFFDIHGNSDASYALVDGADGYPDLFVGRFSAESVPDLETQVERTIRYERDLDAGEWLHRAAGLGSVWGSGFGYNGWNGVESLEAIRIKLIGYDYTDVAQLYEEGEPPFSIIPVEAWEVTEVLHDGIGLLNVDGNADIYWLNTGNYTIAHVDALENSNELPLVYLAAPYAGNFEEDCFAEAWLRATHGVTGEPTGAIAIYACSNALQYAPPQAAMHETIDLLVDQEKQTVGGLLYNGACWMMDLYGAPDQYDTFRNFNILGDASLIMRSDTPEAMTIVHEPEIHVGETEFGVSTGVAEALVCLSTDGGIVAADYADGSGEATLAFDAFADPTELTLTVTACNRITSIETVPVTHGTGVTGNETDVRTGLRGLSPNPFRAETVLSYGLEQPSHVRLEIYDVAGRLVTSLVSCEQPAGTHTSRWDGRDAAGVRRASGVYFARLSAGGRESTRKVLFLR